jgi:serine/threonine protein kinase
MRGQLVVIAGPDLGRSFSLVDGQTLLLGRGQNTESRLKDPAVSRVHCEVQVDEGKILLKDSGSSSGTQVNGKRISGKYELRPGDHITIGSTQIRYQLEGEPDASTVMTEPAGATKVPSEEVEQLAALVGTSLGHFAIQSAIAKGPSSFIFRAMDTKDNREVALKVLAPEFSQDEEEMQRFVRTMKTVLPLKHPNLVTLYGAGKTGNHCWVAMEYIDGESLTQVIERIGIAGMLDWRNALRVAIHVARALAYAHEQNIIHRNITPQNIMIRHSDKATKLGDLMLAKALEGTLAKQVTKPGELVGDVSYMSPERTRGTGAEVDGRSDIYGLGATVYALLTGRPPCEGTSLVDTITKIRSAEPVKPKKYQLAIPDLFEGAVLQMLAKRPDDRFQSAEDLVEQLERVAKFNAVTV